MDLSKYNEEQLNVLMTSDRSSDALKKAAGAELASRGGQKVPPVEGNAITNFLPSVGGVVADTFSGLGQLVSSPIDTLTGMPAGIASHYNERYLTPEEGQPWYSDAVNTFNADPAGMMMDILPFAPAVRGLGLASKAAGAGRTGSALTKTANALDRMDPVNLLAGGAQVAAGRAFNKWDGSPEAAMASNYYGAPTEGAVSNIPEYLTDVGRLMDEGATNKPETQKAYREKVLAQGDAVGEALEGGATIDPARLVQRLDELKQSDKYNLPSQGPKRAEIDSIKADIESRVIRPDPNSNIITDASYAVPGQSAYPVGVLDPVQLNKLKTMSQGDANYNPTQKGENMAKEANKDAARIIREEIVEVNPQAVEPMAEYGDLVRRKEILDRGIAGEVASSGKGVVGDFVAKALNATAPVLTGQGRMTRMNARRGNLGESYYRATAPTYIGYGRQGAYLADKQEEPERPVIPYRRGRLSD